MYSPKGSIHQFSNPFDGQARALIVQSPDIGAQYFLDVQATASAGGPPDKAALVAVMARYGLVPARPGGPIRSTATTFPAPAMAPPPWPAIPA